jgi:hypothetical protein
MDERALLARYAATALLPIAGVEWLLGRTISRMAAAPTLEGLPRTIVEVLGRTGIFVLSTSFLLAASLVCLSVLSFGARATQERKPLMLALAYFLPLFTAFAIAHSFLETQIWVNVVFNILALVAMWWVALSFVMHREVTVHTRIAVLLVALAWSGWYYYVLGTTLEGAVFMLNLGEMIAVAAVFALFAAIAIPGREWSHIRRWVAPVLLALLFSIGNIADMLADQGFTGVFTTWSVGFNLFLPWPLYAVALALFTYGVLTCFARSVGKSAYANANTGLGLLLIVFAGYNLQLPYQHLLAVLSLMLLTGLACPFGIIERSSQRERRIETPPVLS